MELALKTLKSLGLSIEDAQLYLLLSKKGPHGEEELISFLKISKTQFHLSINRLLANKMVSADLTCSVVYSAISFEKVLDEFLRTSQNQVRAMESSVDRLYSLWDSTTEASSNKKQLQP